MLETSQEKIVATTSLFALIIGTIYATFRIKIRHDYNYEVFIALLLSLVSVALTIYNLSCVISGGCTVWSWLLTLLIGASAILSVVLYGQLFEKEGGREDAPVQRRVRLVDASGEWL
jgi:hypothetical protein